MWLASAFCHLSSAVSSAYTFSTLMSHIVPRIQHSEHTHLLLRRSASLSRTILLSSSHHRRRLAVRLATATMSTNGDGDGAESRRGGSSVPKDVASLLRDLYNLVPAPRVCLSTTGSGGQAISWMLGVPGASACLLEASVPYSMVACDEKLGGEPVKASYCTPEVAESLAREAYMRAVSLCVAESDRGPHALSDAAVIGVGCTAAVASSRPKRGLHRCFVCTQKHDGVAHYQLELAKGRRDRAGEDAAVSRVILQATAESSGLAVPSSFKNDHLIKRAPTSNGDEPEETAPEASWTPEPDALEALVAGRSRAVLIVPKLSRGNDSECFKKLSVGPAGAVEDIERNTQRETAVALRDAAARAALSRATTVILPGSYNPVHRGHLRLLQAARTLHAETCKRLASEQSGNKGAVDGSTAAPKDVAVHAVFEVSVVNADKGGLSADEVRKRALQFSDPAGVGWPFPVVLTRAPLFSQKARLFPRCAFVVGADTAKRIVDTKYYGNSKVEMVAALSEIRHLGCSFIVGGRKGADGGFETLEDVLEGKGLPESVRCMFHGLDEKTFREDLSSTSIRAGNAKPDL